MEGALMYEKGYLRFPKNTTLVFADVGPTQMMAPDFYEIQRESGRDVYKRQMLQKDFGKGSNI